VRDLTTEVELFYWFLKRILVGPVLRVLFRPWVEGLERVPPDGPVIFASNHLSFSDSIFLPLVVERRITFLAKSDYFTGRGLKGRLTAGFFKQAGQLPVDRSGGAASDAAIRTGLRVLRSGAALGIYPEGTRSPDGRLYRGKTGVARMALEGRVPVIPVAMIDTEKAQPPGQVVPNIRRIGVRLGEPLDFSRYYGLETDRFVLRSVTDEIMYALMELSNQEYVDIYAASMKERLKRAVAKHTGSADPAQVPQASQPTQPGHPPRLDEPAEPGKATQGSPPDDPTEPTDAIAAAGPD
jgi:1-acyl-sn-glycerol-3-phosphate acyltransferase